MIDNSTTATQVAVTRNDNTRTTGPASDEPRLLNIDKFSARVGISARHGRLLVEQRAVAVVRIGRRVLIPASEVDRLIDEATVPARRPIAQVWTAR